MHVRTHAGEQELGWVVTFENECSASGTSVGARERVWCVENPKKTQKKQRMLKKSEKTRKRVL